MAKTVCKLLAWFFDCGYCRNSFHTTSLGAHLIGAQHGSHRLWSESRCTLASQIVGGARGLSVFGLVYLLWVSSGWLLGRAPNTVNIPPETHRC